MSGCDGAAVTGVAVTGDVGRRRSGWTRDAAVVFKAVAPHPGLWPAALGAVHRLARPGWWRHRPFLPVPGDAYWHFRLVTAYGGDGDPAAVTAADVVAYLRWCQRARPRRG
jgi:hypothetical protein